MITSNFLKAARNHFVAGICSVACLVLASPAMAAPIIGLNPSSPLTGYDLGGGTYATLIGVQSPNSLVGETITSADLFGSVNAGNVLGFYYAAGNPASNTFDNSNPFGIFTSDTLSAGSNPSYDNRVFDSLWVTWTGTNVVFSNGDGGTTTAGIGANYITGQNPFAAPVPVPTPSVLALFGMGLLGLALRRRKIHA